MKSSMPEAISSVKTASVPGLSEQKIIACCNFKQSMDDVITHGVRLARTFGKELCLFHPLGSGGKEERQEAQKKLGKVIRNLKDREPDLPVSSLTLKGNLIDSVERLAEDYDGIMIILTTENMQEKLTALRQSFVPFLFIHGSSEKYLQYNRVMLPVDDAKAAKNMTLWASYFGRFNEASIEILVTEEKSEELQKRIKKNLKAIKELLSNLKLKVHLNYSGKNNSDLSAETVNTGLKEQFNLVIMPNRQISTIDDLFDFREAKIIKQAGEMPVLYINSNLDMYILCD